MTRTSLEFQFSLSELDFQRFGVVTAKTFLASMDDFKAAEDLAVKNAVDLLIARIPVEHLAVAQEAMVSGYLLMDTLAYYSHELLDSRLTSGQSVHGCRMALESDAKEVKGIARRAFHGYGSHYHADPRLDQDACDELYSDWAYRSCVLKTVADTVLVHEIEGKIAGFATLKKTDSGQLAEGPLFAVDAHYRGRGVFKSLLHQALCWAKEEESRAFVYSTQITNNTVLRTLCLMGFIPVRHVYTFHKWFDR